MVSASHILKIVIQVTEKGNLKNTEKGLENINKTMPRINKGFSTFDARLLSVLFGGMALQRAFGGILRSIFDTFTRAEDNTSGLARATTRLQASWEFLKFSLMDALNTDAFIGIIDKVVSLVNWFSQLGDDAKAAILLVSGGLFLIGTGLLIIAEFKLFWDAVFGVGGFANSARGLGTATAAIKGKTIGTNGVFTAIKKFLAVGFTIKALFDLDAYLNGEGGENKLRTLINDLGSDIGLIGLATNTPWLLGLGVVMKLIPFGEDISNFGRKLAKRGIEKFKTRITDEPTTEKEAIGNIVGTFTGGLEGVAGLATLGLGTSLEFINNYIDSVDTAGESTNNLDQTMLDKIVPSVETVTDKIGGEKNSLVSSLKDTGEGMDTIAGDKTTDFISSQDTIIENNDKLIQSNDDVAASFRRRLKAFQLDVDDFTDSSPITDENP